MGEVYEHNNIILYAILMFSIPGGVVKTADERYPPHKQGQIPSALVLLRYQGL